MHLLASRQLELVLLAEALGGGSVRRRMRTQLPHDYDRIISIDNLLAAWQEFQRGKRGKMDVQRFEMNLADNIFLLHHDLVNKQYRHGAYQGFYITDPKPRHIHKASVRDRVLHHAVYRTLYPFFDRTFISDSFSCRENKGTHKAMRRFQRISWKASKNNTQTCWVLKCDVRKFFASIDHEILLGILQTYIPDQDIIWLLRRIVSSFSSMKAGKGLPLGNLTSQLLVNIYMNEFDQWIKHRMKSTHYIRYADDFVLLSCDRQWLIECIPLIAETLDRLLDLELHPRKVGITTLSSGVDFLGWVHFPDYRVLRTTTKRRMFRRVHECPEQSVINSYLGMIRHGRAYKIREKLLFGCI